MRNNITIFTVSKENKVLFLETNLTDFLKGFEKIEANAPHYNTLYKNFANADIYIKGDYCFQKFIKYFTQHNTRFNIQHTSYFF